MSSTADATKAPADKGDQPVISNADTKMLHAIFQNVSGKIEYDIDAVAATLGLSVKTVRNRWCEMRSRYNWGAAGNNTGASPAKVRKGAAANKSDPTTPSRVNKRAKAPVTRKTVSKSGQGPSTPAGTDDEDDAKGKVNIVVKSETTRAKSEAKEDIKRESSVEVKEEY